MKKILSYIFISITLITISNTKQYADKIRAISLEESLNIIKKQDATLKKLRYEEKLNEATYLSNTFDFLPKINAGIKRTPEITFLNPKGASVFTAESSINLPVYDRKIIYERKQIKKEQLKNKYAIQERLNQINYEISELYLYIIHLEKIILILKEEYQNSKNTYELNKRKLKLKKIIDLDLLLIEGFMVEAHNELELNINKYNEAKLKLIHKLRLTDEDLKLQKVNKLFRNFRLKPAQYYINTNQRKEIKIKELENLIAKDIYEIERSIYYPKIELTYDVELTSINNYSLSDRLDWSIFLIASFSIVDELSIYLKSGAVKAYNIDEVKDEEEIGISLFEDNSKRIDRKSAKYLYLSSIEELTEYKLKIKEDIITAYNEVRQQHNEIKKTALYIKIGQRLTKKAKFEYKIGKNDIEGVMEAKREEMMYKLDNEIAKFNFDKAILSLKMITGTLWKEL